MTAWYFNNVRITVVDLKEAREIIIAKLQPLSEGTYYQTFGHVNPVFNLSCFIVGQADKNTIADMATYSDNGPYTLNASGLGLSASFYLEKADIQWMASYRQTFRPDKSPTDIVYKANLTLDAIA